MFSIFITIIRAIFLAPIAFVWEKLYVLRRFAFAYGIFKDVEFQVPIISIGNLVFGGTGKTPFTMWLAEHLNKKNNKRVMILMRGYKGRLEHSRGIIRSNMRLGMSPFDFGDEALLYSRRLNEVSVVVGKNRADNLKHYFSSELPDVVLLDDGHQHLRIKSRLNIVLFDALLPLEKYKVFPLGYLREGFDGLRDADVILWGRADQAPPGKIAQLEKLIAPFVEANTCFGEFCFKPSGLFNERYSFAHPVEVLKNRKVICLAAIASPLSFFKMIEGLGAEIVHRVTFPDHHYYTVEEIGRLIEEAKREDAFIITTEKDMVKLRRVIDDERILYLQISVSFLRGEDELIKRINAVL